MTKHFRLPAVRAHKRERGGGGLCFPSVFVCAVMVNNLLMTVMVANSRNSFIRSSFLERRGNFEAFIKCTFRDPSKLEVDLDGSQ